jgi:phosphoribosylformylglycinamidine synthase
MNPHYGDFDPYWMAAAAIDEAVRNCVAVGADPARIAILDNFCWGNTERPETLGSLVRAAIGCQQTAIAFGTPFISGKDSLNNEFSYVDTETREKKNVAIPSSLLISAIGQVADVRTCVTMDLKEQGNSLYLVGVTREELGGSHYALVNHLQGGRLPHVDLKQAPQIFTALHQSISAGLVRSCHDLSEGGFAVAAAEMAFAGGLGVELDIERLAADVTTDPAALLFSESTTRFLLEVTAANVAKLTANFANLPFAYVGVVTNSGRVVAQDSLGGWLLDISCAELKSAWQKPLSWS